MIIKSKDEFLYRQTFRREKANRKEIEQKSWRRVRNKYVNLFSKNKHLPVVAKDYVSKDEIINNFKWVNVDIDFEYQWNLRDYQNRVIDFVYEHWCGLVDSKTWTGKSHIIMGLINKFKKKTLIVVSSRKLIKEMEEKFWEFTKWKYSLGLYYSKQKDTWTDVLLITKTSYVKLYKNFKLNNFVYGNKKITQRQEVIWWPYYMTIVDECDTGISKDFVDSFCNSWTEITIGLTGTPYRPELTTLDLQYLYWYIVKWWDYLVRPARIYQVLYKWNSDDILKARELATNEYTGKWDFNKLLKVIEDNEVRKEKLIDALSYIIWQRNLTFLLFDRVEHTEKRAGFLQEKLWDKVWVVHGKTKDKDDEELINNIRKRIKEWEKWFVVCATTAKMGRWVDVDLVDTVILYSKLKIKASVIQAIGRALRESDYKQDVEIFTINDSLLSNQMYKQREVLVKEFCSFDWKIKEAWTTIYKLYINKENWKVNYERSHWQLF